MERERRRTCRGPGPGGTNHINERSCALRDVVAPDLRGASMETTGLFAHVLPQPGAVRARPAACGHYLPQTSPPSPTRVGMPAQAAGAPPQPPRYTMMDVKTLSGVNELYYERGSTARTAAPAQGASGGAGAAGERRVHCEGAHAGPRAQQAGGRHALPRRA
jgi:hypothetical protein